MGNLPSTVSCDPSTPELNPSGLYSISGRTFGANCQYDTTGPVLSITSADFYTCITNCADDRSCKAISWNHGTCYQKSAAGSTVPNSGVSSFVSLENVLNCPASDGQTYTSSNNEQFTITCGTDWSGVGDIGSSSQPTFQGCVDDCSTTDECVAVVYSGNACYKKSAIGNASKNPGVSAAYLTNMPPAPAVGVNCPASDGQTYSAGGATYAIHCDTDYFGGDLTSLSTASFADCIAACDSNEQCIDVSYHYGACYLKNHLTTLSSSSGVWTAVSDRKASQPSAQDPYTCPSEQPYSYTSAGKDFTITCSTDYSGGDFTSLSTDSLQACVDACASHEECVALAYRGNSCYLKSTLTAAQADSGVRGAKLAEKAPAPVNNYACAEPYSCRVGNANPCSGSDTDPCYCFNSVTFGGGFCTHQYDCNQYCVADSDCPSGQMCTTDTCCPNGNGSVCVAVTDARCTNPTAPRYLFARVKRSTIFAATLGGYVDVTPSE